MNSSKGNTFTKKKSLTAEINSQNISAEFQGRIHGDYRERIQDHQTGSEPD